LLIRPFLSEGVFRWRKDLRATRPARRELPRNRAAVTDAPDSVGTTRRPADGTERFGEAIARAAKLLRDLGVDMAQAYLLPGSADARAPRHRRRQHAGLSQPADDLRLTTLELGELALAACVPPLGACNRLIEQR
jgi:hypothetical protein